MSEILSIEQLRQMAQLIIDIPNFDGTGTIKVRVQKPRLMSLATQGKIPNHLMNIAVTKLTGKKPTTSKKEPSEEEKLKQGTEMIELYCFACLVEPSYNDFQDIMTDDQKLTIFDWSIGNVSALDSFRTNKGNGTSDNNGQEVPEKAE